jgi:antitoxin PrlF
MRRRFPVVSRDTDLLELAGTVEVPPEVGGMSWDEILNMAWERQWRDRDDAASGE